MKKSDLKPDEILVFERLISLMNKSEYVALAIIEFARTIENPYIPDDYKQAEIA
jgi:hypothetical protein